MMMEKPQEESQNSFAPAPTKKKATKSAEDAVKELEQRLASLGAAKQQQHNTLPAITTAPKEAPPPSLLDLAPPTTAPPAMSNPTPAVKTGKNALLARIMAAQEKAKGGTNNPPPPPPPAAVQPPPPAFDISLLPPQTQPPPQAPPPSFDAVEDSLMMQLEDNQPPPPTYAQAPPPSLQPSAPAFEDLLGMEAPVQPPAMAPPAAAPWQPVAPPPIHEATNLEEEMIMGLEGLSLEERRTLLEEQRTIMKQIESEKAANQAAIAAAQADNFDMRSTSNAVTALGGSRTAATTPATSAEEEDRRLAEALQNEEYAAAGEAEERPRAASRPTQSAATSSSDSWWSTVTNMFTIPDPKASNRAVTPRSAPAASSASTTSRSRTPPRSSSESISLMAPTTGVAPMSTSSGGARVAKSQPLFSCVVDSVNSTVNTLTGGTNLDSDTDGRVHGVDSSSLLAVSNVGRQQPSNNPQNY